MLNGMVIAQEKVSRPLSINAILSNLTWNWGVGAFFLSQVPYMYSNSPMFARRIAAVSHWLWKRRNGKSAPFRMTELGAGMGKLSAHILNILAKDYPKQFNHVKMEISEYSDRTIDEMNRLHLFEAYKDRITILKRDILQHRWQPDELSHFIYMSYLIDSVDTVHVEVENGQLYELLVQTAIADDAIVMDTTSGLPEFLESTDIADLLQSDDNERKQLLSPKIKPLLRETFHRIPLADSATLSDADKTWLVHYAGSLPQNENFLFNYPVGAHDTFTRLLKEMPRESIMLAYDFGRPFPHRPAPDTLMSHYGTTQFYQVNFHLFTTMITEAGLHHALTTQDPGKSQVLMAYKGDNHDGLTELCARVFPDVGVEHIMAVLKKCEAASSNPPELTKEIDALMAGLSDEEKNSVLLNLNLGWRFLEKKQYDLAIRFALKSILHFEEVALPAHLIIARAYWGLNRLADAQIHYKKALEISPDFPDVNNELSLICAHLGQWTEYVEHAERFLHVADTDQLWEQYITLALVYLQLKLEDPAEEIITHIRRLPPRFVPAGIREKAELLHTKFFTSGLKIN